MNHHNFNPPDRNKQSGVTLIELMVGIAIGLLTIAVAMGAIMAMMRVRTTNTIISLVPYPLFLN